MENQIIRTCPNCHIEISLLDITCDPTVLPAGMDSPDGSEQNICYLFVHIPCGSSMIIPVEELRALLPDPDTARGEIPCYCLEQWQTNITVQRECNRPCKYEPYRRFLVGISQIKQSTGADVLDSISMQIAKKA